MAAPGQRGGSADRTPPPSRRTCIARRDGSRTPSTSKGMPELGSNRFHLGRRHEQEPRARIDQTAAPARDRRSGRSWAAPASPTGSSRGVAGGHLAQMTSGPPPTRQASRPPSGIPPRCRLAQDRRSPLARPCPAAQAPQRTRNRTTNAASLSAVRSPRAHSAPRRWFRAPLHAAHRAAHPG